MEREIKFRVWDISKKVFIPIETWAVTTTINHGYFAVMIKDWEDYKEGEYHYPVSQTLSQYTGLKDKNGTEIYEGDIVRILYTDWPSSHDPSISLDQHKINLSRYGKVVFSAPEYCLEFKGYTGNIEAGRHGEREVIGNIYENPERLS